MSGHTFRDAANRGGKDDDDGGRGGNARKAGKHRGKLPRTDPRAKPTRKAGRNATNKPKGKGKDDDGGKKGFSWW